MTFLKNERGDSQLIVTLVLIAVAIGLCIVFRNAMGGILNSAIEFIKAAVTALFNTSGDSIDAISPKYSYVAA